MSRKETPIRQSKNKIIFYNCLAKNGSGDFKPYSLLHMFIKWHKACKKEQRQNTLIIWIGLFVLISALFSLCSYPNLSISASSVTFLDSAR